MSENAHTMFLTEDLIIRWMSYPFNIPSLKRFTTHYATMLTCIKFNNIINVMFFWVFLNAVSQPICLQDKQAQQQKKKGETIICIIDL